MVLYYRVFMKIRLFYLLILIMSFTACKNRSIDGNWYFLDINSPDTVNYSEVYIQKNRICFVSKYHGVSPILHFEIEDDKFFYEAATQPAFSIIDVEKNYFIIEISDSLPDTVKTFKDTFYRLGNSVKDYFDEGITYDSLLVGFYNRYDEYLIRNNIITRKELENRKNDTSNFESVVIEDEFIPIIR